MTLKTEPAVYEALRKTFPTPQYAVLPGVADGTGANKRRTVDALIQGLYPSRGLTLAGVEIKTNRQDVLRELANPAKQESVFRFCDRFWLAVGDPTIVKLDEVPAPWGLLVPGKGGKMMVIKNAPALTPEPMTREFLAAILRKAQDRFDGDGLHSVLLERARADVAEELTQLREEARAGREAGRLRERLAVYERFTAKAGLYLTSMTEVEVEAMAGMIRTLTSKEGERLRDSARRQAAFLQSLAQSLDESAKRTLDALDSLEAADEGST